MLAVDSMYHLRHDICKSYPHQRSGVDKEGKMDRNASLDDKFKTFFNLVAQKKKKKKLYLMM